MDPKKTKLGLPFYIPPQNVPLPSEIISDARNSLKNPRSLPTKRPFTPRDERRSLFPTTTCRNPDNRPPSAFRYKLTYNSVADYVFQNVYKKGIEVC